MRRWFWLLLVLAGIAGVVASTVEIFQSYMSYETTLQQNWITHQSMSLPDLTICPMSTVMSPTGSAEWNDLLPLDPNEPEYLGDLGNIARMEYLTVNPTSR